MIFRKEGVLMVRYQRSIRRRIEKVHNRINHSVQAAAAPLVLHTALDSETIVRTIIQMTVAPTTIAGPTSIVGMQMEHQQNAVEVRGLGVVEAVDVAETKGRLWEDIQVLPQAIADGFTTRLEVDNRGMRKLEPGDTIVWKDQCTANDDVHIAGTVELFFKE